MKYEDLTEQEKLILKARRMDSWRYVIYKLWEIAVKEETDEI